jgi:hypothetical protein
MDRFKNIFYWVPDRWNEFRDWLDRTSWQARARIVVDKIWSLLAGPWRVTKAVGVFVYAWVVSKITNGDAEAEAAEAEDVEEKRERAAQVIQVETGGGNNMLKALMVLGIGTMLNIAGSILFVSWEKSKWIKHGKNLKQAEINRVVEDKNVALERLNKLRRQANEESERRLAEATAKASEALKNIPEKTRMQCAKNCSTPEAAR